MKAFEKWRVGYETFFVGNSTSDLASRKTRFSGKNCWKLRLMGSSWSGAADFSAKAVAMRKIGSLAYLGEIPGLVFASKLSCTWGLWRLPINSKSLDVFETLSSSLCGRGAISSYYASFSFTSEFSSSMISGCGVMFYFF